MVGPTNLIQLRLYRDHNRPPRPQDPATGISFSFLTDTLTTRGQDMRRYLDIGTLANDCAAYAAGER